MNVFNITEYHLKIKMINFMLCVFYYNKKNWGEIFKGNMPLKDCGKGAVLPGEKLDLYTVFAFFLIYKQTTFFFF